MPSARARAQPGAVTCAAAPSVLPASSQAAPNSSRAGPATAQCVARPSTAIAA